MLLKGQKPITEYGYICVKKMLPCVLQQSEHCFELDRDLMLGFQQSPPLHLQDCIFIVDKYQPVLKLKLCK